MRIKHKQKKPDTVTDQFEKLDGPDATETDLKFAEKNFRAFLKEMSLQQSSSISELHQIKTAYKDIIETKILTQIEIVYSGKSYPYNFLNIRGTLIPDYLYKEIFQCNFLDVEIMRAGTYNSKNSIIQLFTGIVIIFSTFIKSILVEVVDPTITIEASLQRCQEIIDTYEEDHHKLIISIFEYLAKAIDIYEKLDLLDSFIEDPEGAKKQYKNEPCLIDELKTHRESMYIDSGIHLEQAINKCIALGLFKEYQRCQTINKKISKPKTLCKNHSLLNSQFLLRKLNGSTLNLEGNSQKKQIYNAFDKKIIDLISDNQYEKKYKNRTELYRVLAEGISEQLYEYMKNHRQDNNHKNGLMPDNLATRIRTIINKNDDLKKKFLQQFEK